MKSLIMQIYSNIYNSFFMDGRPHKWRIPTNQLQLWLQCSCRV